MASGGTHGRRIGAALIVVVTVLAASAVTAPGADARTRVVRPAQDAPPGYVKYRIRPPAKRIVRAVLVRGQVRRTLRLGIVRRAARRGALFVRAAPWGVRQRLRLVVDRRRPRTRLTSGPRRATMTTEARFRFRASERAAFECRLDGGRWRRCRSPVSYDGLTNARHRFAVRARDRAGNRDRTPARRRWQVRLGADPNEAGRPAGGPEVAAGQVLLSDPFTGPDGVITNHYAYWSDDERAYRSPTWESESGCALRSGDTMWTGVPTSNIPNRTCTNGSGSEVFRFWTTRTDFGDVDVRFLFRNNGYSDGSDVNPARSWDGVKVYLRRINGERFYTAEINRRQGNVIIQKKCPQDGGTYHLLEQVRLDATAPQFGVWEQAGGTVDNLPTGGVRIQVVRRGTPVLEATDTGVGCRAITEPGRVGVRGDNTDFNIDDFAVRAIVP